MTMTWRVDALQLDELEGHLLKLSEFEGFKREATKTQMMLMVVQNYTRLQIEHTEQDEALIRIQELAQSAYDEPEYSKDILQSLIHTIRGVTINAS